MYLLFVENREIRIESNSAIINTFKLTNILILDSKVELKTPENTFSTYILNIKIC